MTQVTERVRNGVDSERLFATLDAITAQPGIARFQFRASNRWIDGAHKRSTIKDFGGAGGEDTSRAEAFVLDAGEPAVLLGTDTGPNPAEPPRAVRNGFEGIRVTFVVRGDASPEKLREVVERAQARSAVFDVVTHGVPVTVGVAVD
jgi:uncharacterized OsmC-like protein